MPAGYGAALWCTYAIKTLDTMIRRIAPVIFLSLFIISGTGLTQTETYIIPFRTLGKMILIQGSIDRKFGNLIIDTGVPDLLINQRHFPDIQGFSTGAYSGFRSLNHSLQPTQTALVILELNELSTKTDGQIVDLQLLERKKRMDILAMVGVAIFRKYEMEIDYFAEEIRLYKLDKKGDRLERNYLSPPGQVLPLSYQGHLPCLTANMEGVPLRLGMDTGAEINLIHASVYQSQSGHFQSDDNIRITDLNGQQIRVATALMNDLEFGAMHAPSIRAVLVPEEAFYAGLDGKHLHGLLGYEFFRNYRVSINYKKREVYLWDEPVPLMAGSIKQERNNGKQ